MKRLTLKIGLSLLPFTVVCCAAGASRIFDVRDYGAKGDGHANDRGAILDLRRSPGPRAGGLPVIGLKECRDVIESASPAKPSSQVNDP